MNPGSSTSPLNAALADSPKNNYIPMSPGPHHFDFPGFSATLPARKGSTASMCYRPGRVSDVTPPPINRNLKPNRKGEGCVLIISDYCWPRVYSYGLSASKGSRVEHDQSIWLFILLYINHLTFKGTNSVLIIILIFAELLTFVVKPSPLDLRNNGIIDELPFKSPVTLSWSRPV